MTSEPKPEPGSLEALDQLEDQTAPATQQDVQNLCAVLSTIVGDLAPQHPDKYRPIRKWLLYRLGAKARQRGLPVPDLEARDR